MSEQSIVERLPELLRLWTAPWSVTADGIKDARGCWIMEAKNTDLMHQLVELANFAARLQEALAAVEAERDRERATRLKLDKRIHNQRVALRQNWEIVEMRANFSRRSNTRSRLLAIACQRNAELADTKAALAAPSTTALEIRKKALEDDAAELDRLKERVAEMEAGQVYISQAGEVARLGGIVGRMLRVADDHGFGEAARAVLPARPAAKDEA